MQPIQLSQYQRIVILTGAGISVASGIRPFRGPDGLWDEVDPTQVATHSVLMTNPLAIWRLFSPLRMQLLTAQPNATHQQLAYLEHHLAPGQQFTLITQNIDGLHQQAGSRQVIELHGSIHRTRCSHAACSLQPYEEAVAYTEAVPLCPQCQAPLRLDVVLFDEPLPAREDWLAKRSLRDCDLFIAIGTSGTVMPAANFVRSAAYVGARTILINLEPMEPKNPYFQEEYLGRAEELVPQLLTL